MFQCTSTTITCLDTLKTTGIKWLRFINTAYAHTSVLCWRFLSKLSLFCCLVGGLPAPWKLLPSSEEAIAVWLVEFSCATVTKALKEAVADPTWVLSTIATRHGMCWCVVCKKFRKVFKIPAVSLFFIIYNTQKQTNKVCLLTNKQLYC